MSLKYIDGLFLNWKLSVCSLKKTKKKKNKCYSQIKYKNKDLGSSNRKKLRRDSYWMKIYNITNIEKCFKVVKDK